MEKAGILELERKLINKGIILESIRSCQNQKWKFKKNLHTKRNTTRLYHLTNAV